MQPLAGPELDWRVSDLRAACPGLAVEVVERVGSTNTRLLDACRAAPLQQPRLLVAEQQDGGRGRLGRAWTSSAGSLTASLAWPLRCADVSGLSLAVGVALAEALEPAPHGAPRIGLKWPNDLWLRADDDDAPGRKLGGILIETVGLETGERAAVIGFGLNIQPLDVPDARSGVACLGELDPALDAPAALHRAVAPLLRALAAFERDGFAAFEARYRARDLLFGRPIETDTHSGVAAGVATDGALLLRDADRLHRIVSGEVSVRLLPRPAPASALKSASAPC